MPVLGALKSVAVGEVAALSAGLAAAWSEEKRASVRFSEILNGQAWPIFWFFGLFWRKYSHFRLRLKRELASLAGLHHVGWF